MYKGQTGFENIYVLDRWQAKPPEPYRADPTGSESKTSCDPPGVRSPD
jgi:hypothetical protein